MNYDVAIIGAGPVGSTIAFYLTLKGLSVCCSAAGYLPADP